MGILEQLTGSRAASVRNKALQALKDSDLTQVFESAGVEGGDYQTASAALKAVLAERMADYTIKAMKEAKNRKMKLGAAAIIIAAQHK